MNNEREFKVGDWVRFYQSGRLVIGVVQYEPMKDSLGYQVLHTDIGEIRASWVLELRTEQSVTG